MLAFEGLTKSNVEETFQLLQSNWPELARSSLDPEKVNGSERQGAVVMRQGDRVVGHCYWDVDEAGECELSFLCVVAELRGQGLGRKLASHTIQVVVEKDMCRTLVIHCEELLVPFYQALRFRNIGIDKSQQSVAGGVLLQKMGRSLVI